MTGVRLDVIFKSSKPEIKQGS